jgi:mono/diheme cytochrome c family protein
MSRVLKLAGGAVGLLVLAVGAFYVWASMSSRSVLERTFAVHQEDFPIPFPLTAEEIAEAGYSPEEAERVAMEQAVERGRHLLQARYACSDCHGSDFGGGVMVDAFPMGTLLGPNITTGPGSVAADFAAADWDRIVRHGVRSDGFPAVMPSMEFRNMSDQELSDIVAFIRAQPPVDATVPERSLGPLGKVLVATGQIPLSADIVADRNDHVALPPMAEVSAEFGEHLASPCAGCHGPSLSGGPIPGGDPSWAPARNLTPHEEGLAGWSFADFERSLREGVRPDGSPLLMPMTLALPYTQNLTEVEMQALWEYISSMDPLPTGAQ